MNRVSSRALIAAAGCILAMPCLAQTSDSSLPGRKITAIGYFVDGGTSTVNLKGTGLIANASGRAQVRAKPGVTTVEAQVQGLTPPTRLGAEFLTYVLWAVSPEGRAVNLGPVM